MRNSNVYIKRLSTKKLGSTNISIVVLINLLLPLAMHFIQVSVLKYQISADIVDNITLKYFDRTRFLSIILVILILTVIDYIYLIKPILILENTVSQNIQIVKDKDFDTFEHRYASSSVEAVFYDLINDRKNEMEHHNKDELVRQETEMFALQSQIKPHFLYNTLDSIRGLAMIHGETELADMAKALSKLFRSMVTKERRLILLEEEMDNVQNYISIQQFRFANRFEYDCRIDEGLANKYMVPNLLLQPIFENGIMHGIEGKLDKGIIRLSGEATDQRLILRVYDNGVGIEDKKLEAMNHRLRSQNYYKEEVPDEDQNGIGLDNINRRLKLQFGEDFGIYLYSTLGVETMVEITLPIIEAEEVFSEGGLFE